MDLVLRSEVEDVLEEVIVVIVEEIQDNLVFVTGSLVQVRERILCICHLYEVRDNILFFLFSARYFCSLVILATLVMLRDMWTWH